MTIDSNLAIFENINNLFKKYFNWRAKLTVLILISIVFFLLNLHLIVHEFKKIQLYKCEHKVYMNLDCNEIVKSWYKVSNHKKRIF